MNIAYLISAHTDAPQLARLIKALDFNAHFFVHIDKKSDIRPFQKAIDTKNVHFIEPRINVRWGTIVEWDYQLGLIRAAVEYPTHFNRLITLSGMDYPLWSNQKIHDYFARQEGEILAAMPMREDLASAHIFREVRPMVSVPGFSNKWNTRLSILARKVMAMLGLKKSFTFTVGSKSWQLYKGAAWWAITEELGRFIVGTYDLNKADLRHYFRNQHCPAETVVQTIAMNSPLWRSRCIEYPCNDAASLQEKTLLHHIEYTSAIRIWKEDDFDLLMSSGKMFTRKLISGVSDGLAARIEEARQQ